MFTSISIKKKFFTIPYVKSISENFLSITINYKLAYSISNILKSLITRRKDQLDSLTNHNVIYNIKFFVKTEASYIGQTKRKLKTRLNEHISDIKKKIGSPSDY